MEAAYFDPESSKYQTCCCHVKNVTIFICILYLLSGFASVVIAATLQPQYASFLLPVLVIIPFIFLSPIYGIFITSRRWLLPVIFLTALEIITNIATFLLSIYYSIDSILNQQITEELAYKLLGQVFGIFVSLWFFRIFCRCYGYLDDKRKAKKFQYLAMTYQINAMNSMYSPNIYSIPYEGYQQQPQPQQQQQQY